MQASATSIALELAHLLVHEHYKELVERCAMSRLTSQELRRVVRYYGRTLVPPPSGGVDRSDAVPVISASVPTWSVRVPLWTLEEGRCDLTLELTIADHEDGPRIELDDLHVL
jgi:hypothetical protein